MPEFEDRAPETYFDISTGQLLIGRDAYDAQIEAMERSGFPAEIYPLTDLITGDNKLPSFTYSRYEKYKDWTREDFVANGRWLLNLLESSGAQNLTVRSINRAARLGLSPSEHAISEPDRFQRVTNYQQAIGQEKIYWKDKFKNWDVIDMVSHIRKVAEEEGGRPTSRILQRRITDGKIEPDPHAIISLISLAEASEYAGYIVARGWTPRQYQEWGYLFYLANNRLPTKQEMDELSPIGLGPSSGGPLLAFEDSFIKYRKSIIRMIRDRQSIQSAEIKKEYNNGLLQDLCEHTESDDDVIRNVGRYEIINKLMPGNSKSLNIKLCRYDVTGEEFVAYLKRWDDRVEGWMVEGAARKALYYPEIFPNGDFLKSLEMPDHEPSFFDDTDASERLLHFFAIYEKTDHHPRSATTKTPSRQQLYVLRKVINGVPLSDVSQRLHVVPDVVRARELRQLKDGLGARNSMHLPRLAIDAKLSVVRKVDGPQLTLKQKEMLELMSHGASTNDLAKIVGLSPFTVRERVRHITTKLEAKSKTHAVMLGFQTGNTPLPGEDSYLPVRPL